MANIFISYSRKGGDKKIATFFYNRLIEAGHEAFLDVKTIRGGEKWTNSIDQAIRTCDYFVVLLSKDSSASDFSSSSW